MIAARRTTEYLDEDLQTSAAGPSESAEQRERLKAVTRAIATLPAEQRAALILREFESLSYQEVADVLGTTVAAVKGRIHRARIAVLNQTAGWR